MRSTPVFIRFLIVSVFVCATVHAGQNKIDTTVGGLRVELHVLPPELFFSKAQISAGLATDGVLVIGGASPLLLGDKPNPTHHLAVRIFDSLTSQAITNAKVEMSYQPQDEKGVLSESSVDVPIVVMQDIGNGEESTHYGNNVAMINLPYVVSIIVNDKKIQFKLDRLFEPGPSTENMSR
jgi:hypothetical protein